MHISGSINMAYDLICLLSGKMTRLIFEIRAFFQVIEISQNKDFDNGILFAFLHL